MDEYRSETRVPADHPCFAGHFPGNPIVPGVVLLERVEQAACQWLGSQLHATKFPNVKFLSPLLPEEILQIHLQGAAAKLRFTCSSGTRLLAQGSLEMSA